MDDVVAQFTGITSASPERASQYLQVADGDLEQAIALYFENDGADMGAPAGPSRPSNTTDAPTNTNSITSGDESTVAGPADGREIPPGVVEDDEAMARRLQDEMYGSMNRPGDEPVDEHGVRAPIGRTTETLLGPEADWRDDPEELSAAVQDQIQRRNRANVNRPGIFNQQAPSSASIWENGGIDPEERRQNLSRATGGASERSSKSTMLAEMYRPPFELISPLRSWEGVRAKGKEDEKWILINIQDPNVFDCQVLNRDIWKDESVQETVREHFIFKQYAKSDPQASNYIRFYFQNHDSQDAYPHIAIVDPRTGERVKVWSGAPAPKAGDFLMQLHEFLERYSLKAFSKNPVAKRKAESPKQKDVHQMSEDEMMEMAMHNSLGGGGGAHRKEDDPDSLTRDQHSDVKGKGKQAFVDEEQTAAWRDSTSTEEDGEASPFAQISSNNPHTEPLANTPNTTRIQFRHPGGRVVRRFDAADPVRRIFEWLKAEPLDDKHGVPFDLIFMGKNLLEVVDSTIEQAGLKNGSVMVEFLAA